MEIRNLADFSSLVIKLASSDQIKSWSHGEITKPETINYRTLKPEKNGLFDERIFGPTKDWECYCGKYKRIRYRGVVCDKCGVEVTQARVRRERMGHITLATPVAHVWFFKSTPSKMALLLDLPSKALEQVIYLARYIVLSIDEDERKAVFSRLEKEREVQLKQQKNQLKERLDAVEREFAKLAAAKKKEVKKKEQLALALEELELDKRKKKTTFAEAAAQTEEKTQDLFERLAQLVRAIGPKTFLSEEQYQELAERDANSFFTAKMGAEAVEELLENINLEELVAKLRSEISEISGSKLIKASQRLHMVDGMRKAGISSSWLILRILPVLPPDLRPMVQLSGGRFATSDLNDLYRRIINRNNRLRHMLELGAPEIILRNEKRMLQESVDSFIDASQRQTMRRGRTRQPLRSLSDMLRGKQGRFRQNLLGKRVDYSGRSVIVVGPELSLSECGLPKEMALELFKPFVLREMMAQGISPNVKSAKTMLEKRLPEVFDILEQITRGHPVLLNRAPTLHKLGIQAFYPVLIEGNAIRIHPCVCSGYNADFDGDQMAVHVPLSERAKEEARNLMLPEHNLLKPADGSPITIPATKEMALGVYYLTTLDESVPKREITGEVDEAIFAYQTGKVMLRQEIEIIYEGKKVVTTVGRILFNELLPSWIEYVNEPTSAPVLKRLFNIALARGSRAEVLEMIDSIKNIGFSAGTISGLSFGITDAVIHPAKDEMVEVANKQVAEIEENFHNGLITKDEKKRLMQDVWIDATENLADKTWEEFLPTNPIKVIIDAGVGRASREQVKQIAAMRGLVVDPLGRVVELPTKSNFKEGLSIFEYVTTARGSRKGLTDSALRTADAGYLTRRLVDVAHDVIIRIEDCGTMEGIVAHRGERSKSFPARIIGRTAAVDITLKGKKDSIVRAGEEITEEVVERIEEEKVDEMVVRSPLACTSRYGICAACYGWDLSTKKRVELGTPAGVVAAQSIGEPGTQLTMRVKHTGGIIGLDVTQGLPRVEELFETRIPKFTSPLAEISGKVEIIDEEDSWKVRVRSVDIKPPEEREYVVPKTAQLRVAEGDLIPAGAQLASGLLDIKQVLAIRGLRAAQEYLISEIQLVYESQGIPINEKHFEVIVRKMSDKVQILTSGDTTLLPRELIDKVRFTEENERVLAAGGEPATASVVILGITRASLYTESWLSAASFQDTTKVLTDAALLGKEDKLLGLKENVIIGRLIPVTPERAMLPAAPLLQT
ncbi:DNA-directed RNA polymerase subunit beta' [Candidatus Microgenomates bacterium]|nr:DNA-directed RNA polymerase subunit beta' [Candidatus Microgenomates bacterium]